MSAPISITGKVIGAEQVVGRFDRAGAGARRNLERAVRASGIQVLEKVKAEKLSGQVLKVRTGRLRRSINERFFDEGDALISRVGTNVVYGRFWELGFNGTVNVRSHTRKVRLALGRDGDFVTQGSLGKTFRNAGKMVVFAKKGARRSIKGVFQVKAHTRKVNQKPRPFLRPALAESRDKIRARLAAAITGGAWWGI